MLGPIERLRFSYDHRWSHRHMSDQLDRDLSERGRRRLERHLLDCPECRALLGALWTMVTALGAMRGSAEPGAGARVLAGLHEALERDTGDGRSA